MVTKASKFGFVECADLVSDQKYGAALRLFQQAVDLGLGFLRLLLFGRSAR